MKHRTMQAEAAFKALGPADGEPEGTFEAIVSVFGNVDKFGDRVTEKAFDDTLARWREKAEASGARLPVIFSHDWSNPMSFIGSADPNDVKALPGRGLYVKGQIEHMDTNPVALQVYNLMKSGVITEWSFGYTVPKGGETKAKDGAYDLNIIELHEVGPTLKGVNPATETLGVKSLEAAERATRRSDEELAALREKAYAELNIEGSFEAIQDALCDALRAKYPQPSDPNAWVYTNLVATTADTVVYQVCQYPAPEGQDDEQMYRAPYTFDADGMAHIGEPESVTVAIVPDDDAANPDNATDNVDDGKALVGEQGPEVIVPPADGAIEVNRKAFVLAHEQHPEGLPMEVTEQLLTDPAAYIAAIEEAKAAAPPPPAVLERRQAEAKSCWIEATDRHALPEHRERAWAQLPEAYLGDEELKAASITVGTTNYPIAKPGHRWDVEPDPVGVKAATERLLKGEIDEQTAKALVSAYENLGQEAPAEVLEAAGVKAEEPEAPAPTLDTAEIRGQRVKGHWMLARTTQRPELQAKAWDGAASNYTDEEYAKACILDRGPDAGTAKERYSLPIAKPGNSFATDPDKEGVAAAASRIGQVDATDAQKRTAAKRLAAAYRHLDMDVPEGVMELAGESTDDGAEKAIIPADAAATDRLVDEFRLQEYEREIGKALPAEALEAAALNRHLAIELESLGD